MLTLAAEMSPPVRVSDRSAFSIFSSESYSWYRSLERTFLPVSSQRQNRWAWANQLCRFEYSINNHSLTCQVFTQRAAAHNLHGKRSLQPAKRIVKNRIEFHIVPYMKPSIFIGAYTAIMCLRSARMCVLVNRGSFGPDYLFVASVRNIVGPNTARAPSRSLCTSGWQMPLIKCLNFAPYGRLLSAFLIFSSFWRD